MEKFYRSLLKRSFALTWKNKWLWVFGFFATLIGNGTMYDTVLRSFSNLSEGRSLYFTLREYANAGLFRVFSWTRVVAMVNTDPSFFTASLFTFLLVVGLLSVFIVLAIVSQASLVKSAVALDMKKKISFRDAFALGVEKFWPVFALTFLMRVVMFGFVLLLAFVVSLIVIGGSIWTTLVYIAAFTFILLLAIVVYFITIYSIAFIVLRNKKVLISVRLSWYLFRKHILLNLEVGLLLFVINAVVGILAVLASLFILSPFILVYLLLVMRAVTVGLTLLAVIILGIFALIMVVTTSWYTSFQVITWALVFEELAMKRGNPKLMRLIEGVLNKGIARREAKKNLSKNVAPKVSKKVVAKKKITRKSKGTAPTVAVKRRKKTTKKVAKSPKKKTASAATNKKGAPPKKKTTKK